MKAHTIKTILGAVLIISLGSCDPGFHGKTFIRNDSNYQLELKYSSMSFTDSIISIQPNSRIEIYHFGGLGEGRDFDCCSCEFQGIILEPTDTTKHLIKNIILEDTWNMTNDNRKRYSSHEITCEFVVAQSDIQ